MPTYRYISDGKQMNLTEVFHSLLCPTCRVETEYQEVDTLGPSGIKTAYKCRLCGKVIDARELSRLKGIGREQRKGEPEEEIEDDDVEDLFAKLKEDLDD